MNSWNTTVLSLNFRDKPRQFEYHPTIDNILLLGTLNGKIILHNKEINKTLKHFNNNYHFSTNKQDYILGLSWLKKNPDSFIVGSSNGIINLCKIHNEDLIMNNFNQFKNLTNVHVNCIDQYMIVSGYSTSVIIYDIITGQISSELKEIHNDKINISKFMNLNPNCFSTASFDNSIKMWDIRCNQKPIYTCYSSRGNIMSCFSPDDTYLLSSAIDNEVKQYMSIDGRELFKFNIPKTGSDNNFTRTYYNASGKYILSGSTQEKNVHLYCSYTGKLIYTNEMYPKRKNHSLYIQSLRGNPMNDLEFSVLVNYNDSAFSPEIVHINMEKDQYGNDISKTTSLLPTKQNYLNDSIYTDIEIILNNKIFKLHSAILLARCPKNSYLYNLIPENHNLLINKNKKERLTLIISNNIIDCDIFEYVIHYIYTDELIHIQQKSKINILEKILKASNLFHLIRLKNIIESQLKDMIQTNTIIQIIKIAEENDALQLLEFCEYYLIQHYEIICLVYGNQINKISKYIEKILNFRSTIKTNVRDKNLDDDEFIHYNGSISRYTGHTCNVIHKERVIIMGGANRIQFHNFQSILMLDLKNNIWLRLSTHGDYPPNLIYHKTVILKDDTNKNISLILYGGHSENNSNLKFKSSLYVLNLQTLNWQKIDCIGEPPPQNRIRHTMISINNNNSFINKKKEKNFIIFGGLCTESKNIYNDCYILNVTSIQDNESKYNYKWIKPRINGIPPPSRVAHTAVMYEAPNFLGGCRMIVFGGIGGGEIYQDIHSLQCNDIKSMRWEQVNIIGNGPEARYCHSMVILQSNIIAIFGGTSGSRLFNDLYLLHIEDITTNSITFRWNFIDIEEKQYLPCKRNMQCMWSINDSIYVFGGSYKNNYTSKMKEVFPDVFKINLERLKYEQIYWNKLSLSVFKTNFEPPIIIDYSTLHTDMKKILDINYLSDAKFICLDNKNIEKEKEIKYQSYFNVHKFILCNNNNNKSIISIILENGMKESYNSIIKLYDTRSSILYALLIFLYTNTLQIEPENMMELIVLANKYNISNLVLLIEGNLKNLIDRKNCCSFYEFADFHSLPNLKIYALVFILRDFSIIFNDDKNDKLPIHLFEEILNYRSNTNNIYFGKDNVKDFIKDFENFSL